MVQWHTTVECQPSPIGRAHLAVKGEEPSSGHSVPSATANRGQTMMHLDAAERSQMHLNRSGRVVAQKNVSKCVCRDHDEIKYDKVGAMMDN